MKLNFSLNLEQSQKLVMTPELRQAIEILQYNAIELNHHIHEELMTNPVLEMTDKDNLVADYESKLHEIAERIDWKAVVSEGDNFKHTYQKPEEREEYTMDNMVADEESLHDHLLFQLHFTLLDDRQLTVGQYLIENIDHTGYLRVDDEHVKATFDIGDDDLEEIVQTIQTFEPYGVCARDLQECLLIQVQMKRIQNKLVIEIINHHLEDLGFNRLKVIAKSLDASEKAVQEAVDVIRNLDPKPGLMFATLRDVKYIVPDVVVKEVDGENVILVSESSAPKLNISNYYKSLIQNASTEEATTEYLNQKLANALKLIRSIEQRRNTIYRVVESILEFQADFFEKGTMYLKVLNLKDVAEKIGVHESTVSRAVNGKYMQCPRGTYEMKYFFQSGVSSAIGDGISSESIKSIIKELVDKENTAKPISDQTIANEIDKVGIKVSRRTIAKYREEMGIPGSSKRKRY
ncbi:MULTISPECIES: RNA polymerase factor sigma-54 [unclassified Fusibacter]|uniref:RNA polymerase factor sigma-54 n=1 Tax=unclassified Fusibacter TaxID=2624464 RepID=UPI0013E949DD|nr:MULTISPECIES: RNA polymerase factor sigma-54 [unclassified Fusibacter]MCK8059746.1 RNA polymerase factor sigma-54 [Fusibacter sp. A2]NPE21547.1 RNA polymerase factor sigma-54 [Fusibacter sp. A1]